MAVLDFRGGGFHGVRPRQVRDFVFGEQDRGYDPVHEEQLATNVGLAGRVARALNYFGAVVSVMLLIGMVVWGYQLVTRDVSGIPVVRAMQGEARTAPENPGGELAANEGLAVNTVAAGAAPQRIEQVAIAPAATSLTDEDLPMGALGVTAQPMVAAPEDDVVGPENPAFAEEAATRMAAASDAGVEEGTVSAAVTDETGTPAAPEDINAALTQTASVTQSVRPVRRPARATPAPVQTAAVTEAPAAAPARAETRPKTQPAPTPAPAEARVETVTPASGSALAQIGAFDSEAIARSEWQRLSGRNGSLFAGKSPVIQKTERNGRTFWRLRVAGFDGTSAARNFCGQLKSSGTDCIALNN
ncbi:MAG: SPOR domain-containing protein [Paracoccus sp. (in: a-proteobacteria)]|uniref:SPOR domain-containing protein n=1 Tax=Paracoccus sp. TaxID=267 RepID=UPI0026DFA777|nr:SPOR domain-containing protein [Paracoccus sp. (in: a-proteobacteria)]MDO5621100.1 SPOR domain-containing protein [Paracoccus sp. (in: a-proteobacteria)]